MRILNTIFIIIFFSCNTNKKSGIIKEISFAEPVKNKIFECNGNKYSVNSKLIKITNFSKDVIYNLSWMDDKVLSNTNYIFFKDYMECLVYKSNNGNKWATDELKKYFEQISILVPDFSKNDFLELDVFIFDVINKVNNNELLMTIIPFAKISENPDILFPSSHGTISKYGMSVINGIIKKQSVEVKRKYKKIKSQKSKISYEQLLKILHDTMIKDINNNLIHLNKISRSE